MEKIIFFVPLVFTLTVGCIPIETSWYADLDGDGFGDPATQSIEQISGYIQNAEDCDDSNAAVNPDADEVVDGIDNDCDGIVDQKIAFVTSVTFPSALQGLVGADDRCQSLADAATFSAFPDIVPAQLRFRAWMSNATVSAAQRLSHAQVPYVLSDASTVVADNWDALVSGDGLNHAIDLTELGMPPDTSLNSNGYSVWTGTTFNGSAHPGGHHCDNWTKTGMDVTAIVGRFDQVGRLWTEQPSRSCGVELYFLYCFQQ